MGTTPPVGQSNPGQQNKSTPPKKNEPPKGPEPKQEDKNKKLMEDATKKNNGGISIDPQNNTLPVPRSPEGRIQIQYVKDQEKEKQLSILPRNGEVGSGVSLPNAPNSLTPAEQKKGEEITRIRNDANNGKISGAEAQKRINALLEKK